MSLYNLQRTAQYTIEDAKKITSKFEKECESVFQNLRDSIHKNQLTLNDVKKFEFKWNSRIKKGSRLNSSTLNEIKFDKFRFSFDLMFFSHNKWKIAPYNVVLDKHSYLIGNEKNDKLSIAPDNLFQFGENVATLLMERKLNKVFGLYPKDKEIEVIYKYEIDKNPNTKDDILKQYRAKKFY